MATTDISEYTSAIMSQKKGETVRDAIINAVKVISGSVSAGSRTASTLNGKQLTEFVVNYYNPADNPENKPFAISLNQTKANMKREVDRINYGDPSLCPESISSLGPIQKTGVNNNHWNQASLDRLEVTRREIYEAINEAWRKTPSGAHGSDEYLVLDSDPFEDYPHYISLIGSGEGYALRCSERTEPITENGTYTAPENTGWTKVMVNVADKNISPLTETISTDGTYAASSYGKDGFSFVNVQVPVVSPDDPSYNPENPYDSTSWYSGGGQDGCTVIFYRYEGEKALQTVRVNYGGDAKYDSSTYGTVMSKNADEYFAGWDPEPRNVTHNMKCYAVFKKFKHVEASTGEITDTWEQIASNHGARYNVGDWKILDFGTVTIPLDGGAVGSFKIGKVMMVKIADADATKGTNSTWMSLDLVRFPYSNKIWRKESKRELFFKGIRTPLHDDTGYREPVTYSYQDTDLYEFLNGNSANTISTNLPASLKASIKTVSKKAKAIEYVCRATEELTSTSSATRGLIYYETIAEIIDVVEATENNKFWIPSFGEIFEKKTNFYSSSPGAQNNVYDVLYSYNNDLEFAKRLISEFSCNDDNYNDFFFKGVNPADERNWMNFRAFLSTGSEFIYPWRSSTCAKRKGESYFESSQNLLLRDIGYQCLTKVDDQWTHHVLSVYNGDTTNKKFLKYTQYPDWPETFYAGEWALRYADPIDVRYFFRSDRRWSNQSYSYYFPILNWLNLWSANTEYSNYSASINEKTEDVTEITSTRPMFHIGFCL